MKQIIIISFLILFSGSVFGQNTLSTDVTTYLNNEKKYSKKSYKIVKDILQKTNVNLFIDWNKFKIVPTFKAQEKYLINDLDKFMLSLKMDKGILWNEILIINQPNKDFESFDGITYCESNKCKVYLYNDSPERHKKYEKATEKFIFSGNYDLIFKIENYPQLWFLWKDNQLSLYSFFNETLYAGENKVQLYFKSYMKKKLD
jgi:hypothetical protein